MSGRQAKAVVANALHEMNEAFGFPKPHTCSHPYDSNPFCEDSAGQVLAYLEDAGFVLHREKSVKAARERQQRAEMRARWAEEDAESSNAWARDCLREQRRLADRCTFLAALAVSKGATLDELSPAVPPSRGGHGEGERP